MEYDNKLEKVLSESSRIDAVSVSYRSLHKDIAVADYNTHTHHSREVTLH